MALEKGGEEAGGSTARLPGDLQLDWSGSKGGWAGLSKHGPRNKESRRKRRERGERGEKRRGGMRSTKARGGGGGGGGSRLGMMWKCRDFTEPDPVVPRFDELGLEE